MSGYFHCHGISRYLQFFVFLPVSHVLAVTLIGLPPSNLPHEPTKLHLCAAMQNGVEEAWLLQPPPEDM